MPPTAMVRRISFVVLTACLAPMVRAQGADDGLTLERIMSDPDWIGLFPEQPAWTDDASEIVFARKRAGEAVRDLYRVPMGGGEAVVVEDAERSRISYGDGDWSDDRTRKVFAREGDVFVHHLTAATVVPLTRTNEVESSPFFLSGDRSVAFQRGDNWFVRDLDLGVEWQATDLRLGKDPAVEKAEKTYFEEQQQALFEVLRERKRRAVVERQVGVARQKGDPGRPRLPWHLGEKVEIEVSALSPTGNHLLLVLSEKDESKRDSMPKWITDDGLVENVKLRPHVGAQAAVAVQVVLLDLVAHVRHDLDLATLPGVKEDPLAALRKAAEEARKAREQEREVQARRERGEPEPPAVVATKDKPKGGKKPAPPETKEPAAKPRALSIANLSWSDDGSWAVFQAFSFDNKDRWIAGVEASAGKLVPLERITDPAWIGYTFLDLGWMPKQQTLWYMSEESGYAHLYLRPLDGAKRQLTRGKFEIRAASEGSAPVPTRDSRSFVVVANREHPGIWEAYRVAVDSGELTRLTALGGENDVVLSPDEQSLLILHGTATRPPDVFVQAATPGATARRLTDSVAPEFAAISWSEPAYVTVPPRHGQAPIPARLYTPPLAHAEASAARPAVLFVHGAGYLQNAHQGWSQYFREFFFHSLLVRRGYVVLDIDYRASAGYGRDWRTAIYRQMGTPELEDMSDSVEWLVGEHGVDRRRIGVYGGSYGGFLTLMALFRQPDLFAAGAALRPVTDWAHYNHGYTSNILNTPEVDPEAYRKSSPIEFAAGLAKPLLLCHGMVDDNVVFQDTVRLVQRLIELKKENFETAIYPFEPHSFREPTSWLDEYRRIFNLFERHVRGGDPCSN
jgi:dipeptidyl aminopeptidase/acylaminoacyl peptidase